MNNVVPHRSHQLSGEDFQKLVERTAKALLVRERMKYIIVTEPDEYGHLCERRREVADGVMICVTEKVSQEELQQLLLPTTRQKTAYHLFRLVAHRPFTRGEEMWRVVVTDLCKTLDGMSEGAIARACRHFREQAGQPFFPNAGDFKKCVEDIERDLRLLASPPAPPPKPQRKMEEPLPPRTSKSKRRVKLLCKLGLPRQSPLSKWQRLWLELFMRKARSRAS